MKLDKSLEPFRATIEALNRLLQEFNQRGVIIGGVAVGLLGKPRYTADVDAMFLLSIKDISQFLKLARIENIVPRMQNAEEFARKSRVLLLKHEPTNTEIDISLGVLPFEEEMVERELNLILDPRLFEAMSPVDSSQCHCTVLLALNAFMVSRFARDSTNILLRLPIAW